MPDNKPTADARIDNVPTHRLKWCARDLLKACVAFYDACGGNPPEFLREAYDQTARVLRKTTDKVW